ncbi:hypothetical protein [Kitasatospora sp. NPDC088346]|uniref:hypothetical protein n=1 Tax=Kitasatospora sp. NPDC088346 TaxID=3364073 RepID=UPI0037FFA6B3
MSTTMRRVVMWAIVGVCGAAVVGLILVAALASATTADRWIAVGGAVAALAGALAALISLLRTAPSPASTVVRGNNNTVAGAGAHHNALGRGSVTAHYEAIRGVPGQPIPPASGPAADSRLEVRGSGNSVAGSDAHHNAMGDDAEIDHD